MFELFKSPIIVKELRKQVKDLQHSVSILLAESVNVTSRGNPYRDYRQAIQALAEKYEGTAEWGVQQVRNIIDVRSAFIIGQGIKLVCEDETSREFEFIKDFMKFNNLDEEMPQELAKEAEIEGRICVRLIPNVDKRQVEMRYLSYSTYGYSIETAEDDYQKYLKVKYQDKKQGKEITIEENEFVYKKFSGRLHKVNDVMPKVAMVLRHIEDLDKALKDWRDSNRLFATPTPFFKCQTKEEVENVYNTLQKTNWKVGKTFVGTAEFRMVEMSGSGLSSLEKEIITLAKIISGATGVPVHFLGLPELMSNRAVSTDLFEFINASTNKERHIWEGFYEELFDKAILMANKEFKMGMEIGKIKASILAITEAKIEELARVWLPLYTAGIVDLDYVLSKIPDANKEKILENREKEAEKMLASIVEQEKTE